MNKMAATQGRASNSGRWTPRWLLGVVSILALAAAITSCSSASNQTTVRRVEVPVPYWEAPAGILPLPEPPTLRSKLMTAEEAEAEFLEAIRLVAEDLRACLEDDALVRHLYSKLVTLCSVPPAAEPEPEDEPHN